MGRWLCLKPMVHLEDSLGSMETSNQMVFDALSWGSRGFRGGSLRAVSCLLCRGHMTLGRSYSRLDQQSWRAKRL